MRCIHINTQRQTNKTAFQKLLSCVLEYWRHTDLPKSRDRLFSQLQCFLHYLHKKARNIIKQTTHRTTKTLPYVFFCRSSLSILSPYEKRSSNHVGSLYMSFMCLMRAIWCSTAHLLSTTTTFTSGHVTRVVNQSVLLWYNSSSARGSKQSYTCKKR